MRLFCFKFTVIFIIMFYLVGAPVLVIFPRDKTVLENDVVSFRCFALATPSPSVQWAYNGSVISYGGKYSLGNAGINFGALTVQNVSFYDRGEYTCSYSNTRGQLSASATLTVQGKLLIVQSISIFDTHYCTVRPRFEEVSVPVNGTAGGIVVLDCKASGFPSPSIVWRKNGFSLTQNNRLDIVISSLTFPEPERISERTSRLEIGELVLGDEARYSCFAENSLARPQVLESARNLIEILCEYLIMCQ